MHKLPFDRPQSLVAVRDARCTGNIRAALGQKSVGVELVADSAAEQHTVLGIETRSHRSPATELAAVAVAVDVIAILLDACAVAFHLQQLSIGVVAVIEGMGTARKRFDPLLTPATRYRSSIGFDK